MASKETIALWGVAPRLVHSISRYAIAILLVYVVLSPVVVYAQGSTHKEDLHIGTPVEYITFNQYVDNKFWGDEHDFVRVGATNIGSISELKENVVAVEGQEYFIYMYVHNNAASSLDLTATSVKAQFVQINASADTTQQIRGFIDADNIGAKQDGNGGQTVGSAGEFWDECGFQSMDDRKFTMQYVLGSAQYINNKATFDLSDTIATASGNNGTLIGDTAMNGKISGCADHSGYVVIRLKPIYEQEDEDFDIITTSIKKHDLNTWSKVLDYTENDNNLFDIKVIYNNTSDKTAVDVSFRALLSSGLEYIDGSIRFADPNESGNMVHGNPINDDVLIGSYEPGETAILEYQVSINSNVNSTNFEVKNEVTFNNSSGNTQTNGSRVFISKTPTDGHLTLTDIPDIASARTEAAELATIITSPFVIISGVSGVIMISGAIGALIVKRKRKKQTEEDVKETDSAA